MTYSSGVYCREIYFPEYTKEHNGQTDNAFTVGAKFVEWAKEFKSIRMLVSILILFKEGVIIWVL